MSKYYNINNIPKERHNLDVFYHDKANNEIGRIIDIIYLDGKFCKPMFVNGEGFYCPIEHNITYWCYSPSYPQ